VARKRVLLVDDSRAALMMEQMILASGGYEICTAQNGEEAITVAARERPDLIVLDLVMPKKDGIAACAELRRQEVTRDVPIIIVTTKGSEESMEAAFRAGCTDFVTKPIDHLELSTKVRACLDEVPSR
jgi:DNA-binding response OmpR family regulator